MRQLSFVEPGTVRWEEAPDARLETPDDALVRPLVVTTCDIDHAIVHGLVPFPGPFPLGHEFVAEVVETGGAVRRFRWSNLPGGGSAHSGGERERQPARRVAGGRPVPGRVAGRGRPRGRRLGAEHRALRGRDRACAGRRADRLHRYDRERLAIAERLGARGVEGPPPRRAGSFPITVDASADPAALACALRSVEPYGVCTAVAIYFFETSLPLLEMYTRGVRFVTGRVNARAVIPEVLALVRAGRLHPEVVNSALVPWEDAHEVILADQRKPVFVRDHPASR